MYVTRRRQIFVDAPVQGALAIRVIMHWLFCLLAVFLMLACWTILNDHPRSSGEMFRTVWQRGGPALLGSLLLLPIVMVDCVRFSNRFVGPVLRLRRGVKQLANGEPAQPIQLRKGDFWFEFAADFNRLVARATCNAVVSAEEEEPAPLAARE